MSSFSFSEGEIKVPLAELMGASAGGFTSRNGGYGSVGFGGGGDCGGESMASPVLAWVGSWDAMMELPLLPFKYDIKETSELVGWMRDLGIFSSSLSQKIPRLALTIRNIQSEKAAECLALYEWVQRFSNFEMVNGARSSNSDQLRRGRKWALNPPNLVVMHGQVREVGFNSRDIDQPWWGATALFRSLF